MSYVIYYSLYIIITVQHQDELYSGDILMFNVKTS